MVSGSNDFPPRGFKFRPSEEELINLYLKSKIFGSDPEVDKYIPTIRLSDYDPWDLPHELNMPWENEKWTFFSVREKLHEKGNQCKRKAKSGSWKSTCKEAEIVDSETNECIGKKRILVFKESPWVIHEYALNNPNVDQRDCFVICLLMKNARKTGNTNKSKKAKTDVDIPKSLRGEQSGYLASDAIVLEHDHDETNHGHLSQENSPCLQEGESSYNFTSNSETPTSTSEEHGHAESYYRYLSKENLPCLQGKPIYNFPVNSEILTATSMADERSIFSPDNRMTNGFSYLAENAYCNPICGASDEPNQ